MPITLDATNKKLQIVLSAAKTTNDCPVVSTYGDISTTNGATTLIENDTTSNGTTATDIVSAPSSGFTRAIKGVSVYNADTVATIVTIQYVNNVTVRILCQVLLSPGQTLVYSENGQWLIIPSYLSIDPGLCEGRLTLTSGTPVTTSDVTGATTVYFTPYKGNRISLYTNSAWTLYTFTERSIALGTLTSGLPYDVFIYDNSGTLTLEMVAWTSGTARATAIVLQDGVYVKSGSTNKRYLGTFYTSGTTTTEDSAAKRYLWNYYNRVERQMSVSDTNSTALSTASTSFVEVSTSDRLQYVIGVAETEVDITLFASVNNNTAGSTCACGIGLDSATVDSSTMGSNMSAPVNTTGVIPIVTRYIGYPAIGFHYNSWLAKVGANTGTFYGTAGLSWKSGLTGRMDI